MEVIWEPLAAANPENIIRYRFEVAGRLSARKLLKSIDTNVARLAINPGIGPDTVHIAALFDCRRDLVRLTEELSH